MKGKIKQAMNIDEFKLFVNSHGKDILRFCRMTAGGIEAGDELYQDTMLKLAEKREKLDLNGNIKSYALSVSIFIWKNKRKKHAVRWRIVQAGSLDAMNDDGQEIPDRNEANLPENEIIRNDEVKCVQKAVAELPEKYKTIMYLFYSADMKINEIANILNIPEGTVKTRLRKAKDILKEKLEAQGYER